MYKESSGHVCTNLFQIKTDTETDTQKHFSHAHTLTQTPLAKTTSRFRNTLSSLIDFNDRALDAVPLMASLAPTRPPHPYSASLSS